MLTQNVTFDLVSSRDREKYLPSNCFTLKRFGDIDEGIQVLSGPETGSKIPSQPQIVVGSYGVVRDKCFGSTVYPRGSHSEVRRVYPIKIVREGKRTFYRLKNPGISELKYSIIKVFLGEPYASKLFMHGQVLHVHTGFSNAGEEIAYIGDDALVVLYDGEEISFFFADGHVRTFRQEGVKLVEVELSRESMFRVRIEDAKKRIEVAKKLEDPECRMRRVRYVLSGMVDLFQLTGRNRGNGKVLRKILVQEFFHTLPTEELNLIQKKLLVVCRQIDVDLVRELRRKEREVVV